MLFVHAIHTLHHSHICIYMFTTYQILWKLTYHEGKKERHIQYDTVQRIQYADKTPGLL